MDRAQQIRDARRHDIKVITENGEMDFEVRLPGIEDLLFAGFSPVIADVRSSEQKRAKAIDEQTENMQSDITLFGDVCAKLLIRCCINPKVVEGPTEKDGEVSIADIGDLKYHLGSKMLEILTEESKGVAEGAANFRVEAKRKAVPPNVPDVRDGSSRGPQKKPR